MNDETSIKNNFSVPVAIVVAGILIAGAVYFFANKGAVQGATNLALQPSQGDTASLDKMRAITKDDHVRGNPNAPVKIVEYSDTECPFCKRFHVTMKQIMDEYRKGGNVMWVYRHSPLDQLHPEARKQAEATECANELGGNDKFWAYLDRIYEITSSNNGLRLTELPKIAEFVGLDVAKFNACLSSGKYAAHVSGDLADATATGGNGTPWSILSREAVSPCDGCKARFVAPCTAPLFAKKYTAPAISIPATTIATGTLKLFFMLVSSFIIAQSYIV